MDLNLDDPSMAASLSLSASQTSVAQSRRSDGGMSKSSSTGAIGAAAQVSALMCFARPCLSPRHMPYFVLVYVGNPVESHDSSAAR
jgi:hypothetical protein